MLYCVGGGYWNISKSSKADSSVTASDDAAGVAAGGGGKDEKWISLSQEQQMNTDIRRTIFSVIMSSAVSE